MIENLVVDSQFRYTGSGFSNKLPTGIPTFDTALGGGFPLNGSIVEVYGEEGHGKTTFSYRVCKRCTEVGGYITWVDSETSYDEGWAAVQGVDVSKVLAYRPPYMEKANDIIINDIRSYKETFLPWLMDDRWKPGASEAEKAGCKVSEVEKIKDHMREVAPPHIIVWDSLAASPVKSVAEEGAEYSSGMAYRARLIKSFLSRYMVSVVGCEKISMILINQVIDSFDNYGPSVVTPGGRGLRHGKHLAVYIKRSGSGEMDSENFKMTDYIILALTKNKITPVVASFPVIFSKSRGFLGSTSVLEYLWNSNWFRTAGSWKKFDYETVDEEGEIKTEEISFQRASFYPLIEKRPELFVYLCNVVKDKLVEKFPTSAVLHNVDVEEVIKACLREVTALPDDEEVDSMSGES